MPDLLEGGWASLVDGSAGLLEGPRLLADGSVVFSDVTGGGLWRHRPGGEREELLPGRRGIGGVVPHEDGGFVVTGREVLRVAPDGTPGPLLALDGVRGFNDLSTDPRGHVLVGALRFAPMRGEEPRPGEVWRLGPGGEAEVAAEGLLWPNGIGTSPEADVVYVADFQTAEVLVFAAGDVRGEVFARSPRGSCDGLAVDVEGGVWVALGAGGGVARFEADGRLDDVLEVPLDFVSSVAFGGPDAQTVVVAGVGALLSARVAVAGLPVRPAAI